MKKLINKFGINENESMRSRAVKGTIVVTACYGASQALRLASNLVLTRLLAPDVFGMMAVLNIFIQSLVMFSDVGLNLNVIQSKNADKQSFLDTVWVVQVLRGLGIFLLTLLIAWPVSYAYNQPEFFPALIILGLSALSQGFMPIKYILLERNFKIIQSQLLALTSQAITLFILIALAFWMKSIWALVIGQVFGSFLLLVLVYVFVAGPNNRFSFDKGYFLEIINFGKWIFLSSFFFFLSRQGDKILLSFLIPFSLLGVYTLAVFIAETLLSLFSLVASKVALPLFAKYKNSDQKLTASVYYRSRVPIEWISSLVGGALFFNADRAIGILYDSRYSDAGWMLQILSVSLMLIPSSTLAFQYFTALGKPKYSSLSQGIQVVLIAIFLPLCMWLFDLKTSLIVITFIRSLVYVNYILIMIARRELSVISEIGLIGKIILGLAIGFTLSSISI